MRYSAISPCSIALAAILALQGTSPVAAMQMGGYSGSTMPPTTGMGTVTEMVYGSDYIIGDSPIRSSEPAYGESCTPENPVMGPGIFPMPECTVMQTGANAMDGSTTGYWGVQQGDCTCEEGIQVDEFICPIPGGGCPGTEGSSCSECNAAGHDSLPLPNSLATSAAAVRRNWLPNNRVSHGSLSPGHFTQFDSHIELFPDSAGDSIAFFDAFAKRVFIAVDGLDGDARDGVFHDEVNRHIKELTLLDSNGAATTNVASAASAVVVHRNGFRETFGIFNASTSTASPQRVGRLTRREDRQGNYVDVHYRTWSPMELAYSPDRQWQIETIVDAQGHYLDFTYKSAQVGGRWCVESITRDDGRAITYGYDSVGLTSVVYPDGSTTSIAYGQDNVAQTATVAINDALRGSQLTYHLTNDYMTLSDDDQQLVINQPTGVMRKVELPGDEVQWMFVPNTDPAISEDMVYSGANSATITYGDGSYQDYEQWAISQMNDGSATDAWDAITGSLTGEYYGATGTLTTDQLYTGMWPSVTDANGRTRTYTYDANGFPAIITYVEDGTTEENTYNEFGQVLRHKSRENLITQYEYDPQGRLLRTRFGMIVDNGQDVPGNGYAEEVREYFTSGPNDGLLKTVYAPGYDPQQPNMRRMDYEYNQRGQVTRTFGSAETAVSPRPEIVFDQGETCPPDAVTDPAGRQTAYEYDPQGRKIETTHPDGSTDQVMYGPPGSVDQGRVIKTKDRHGLVTTYEYDQAGRRTRQVQGAAIDADIHDGNADDTPITDPQMQMITTFEYLGGSQSLVTKTTTNGAVRETHYDFSNRVYEQLTYARGGQVLTSRKGYQGEQLLYDEDPYGRRTYYGYRASDGTLIRTVTCTVPEFTLPNFDAVWNLVRDTSPNAKAIVHDAIRDNDGRLTRVIDGRGIETRYEYDSAGRETAKLVAFGLPEQARTETTYDVAGNVTEVRSPRYFDASDTEGYQKAKENWTYTGSNRVATHTEAAGTPAEATESYTYDIAGRQVTHTDFNGKTWGTLYEDCCGHVTASKNPLGHGSISRTDEHGHVTHQVTVADVQEHMAQVADPINAKTLREATTRYDALGRPLARTTWLVALGAVDAEEPPIAGLDGVPVANGLTEQYLYDTNLTDGVGLDASAGATVQKLGGGTFNVTLATALAKLADTVANGGAGISFTADAPGSARVSINPEQEVSFSISDAAGRTVMSGILEPFDGTIPNALITWNCTLHDATTSLSGYGTVLETKSISALGHTNRQWTDAAGRTLRSFDALDKATVFTYDAAGNQLTVRDPNNVGEDVVYDALGRAGLRTDTASDTSNSGYDKAGNRISAIDGKNETTTYTFDARNRQVKQTDRLGGETEFSYTASGQLASLTDAEDQVTSYSYDDAGNKLTETYPDHVGSSTVGQAGYGIISFTYDPAGRVDVRTDQQGDTCTYSYDLAGRLTNRAYVGMTGGPLSGQSYSDTFTYDAASRMLTAVSGGYSNTVTYTYDDAGRKATEAFTMGGQTYTTGIEYDASGQLVEYTYPDGTTVGRSYTDRGQLYQLSYDSTTVDTRAYDDGGRMTSSTYNNGVAESRSYNNDNTLASISFTGAPIGTYSYTWDDNKNKTSESITGVMSNYGFTVGTSGYDDEDRLTNWKRSDGKLDQAWNLSLVGDWNSYTESGIGFQPVTQSRTHGPTHELLSAGGSSLTHDTKGNMTLIPAVLRPDSNDLALKWDFENKMTTADVGNDSTVDVTYKWDALGRRVYRDDGSSAVIYVQVGQQTIADYGYSMSPTSPMYNYVYASYIDEPILRDEPSASELLYFHRNQQYSIVALTDELGAITERYAYSAHGATTLASASGTTLPITTEENRLTYSGREFDFAIDLFHFRTRFYCASIANFLQRDAGYIDKYSLYNASMGIGLLDPSGMTGVSSGDFEDALWCLFYKYSKLGHNTANDESACKYRPLSLLPQSLPAKAVGQLGIDIMLTSLTPILPPGWKGIVTKEFLEEALQQLVCGEGSTREAVVDSLVAILKSKIESTLGEHVGEAELLLLKTLAGQLYDAGLASCKDERTCALSTFNHDNNVGEVVSCTILLCITSDDVWHLSGTCSYKCTEGSYLNGHKTQRCCCGSSFTQGFSGISFTWGFTTCKNFTEGESHVF